MALFRRYLVFLILGLSFVAGLRGQGSVQPDTFRIFSLGVVEPLHYDFAPGTTRTINPPGSNQYSPPYPIPVSGKLVFYRIRPNPDQTKPALKTVVSELNLRVRSTSTPTPSAPYVIILVPSAQMVKPPTDSQGNPLEFHALILDDSLETHPKDHLRVISFSKRATVVAFGETVLRLQPLETRIIPYPPGERTKLKVAGLLNDNWHPVSIKTQVLQRNTRLTLFICDEQPNEFDANPIGIVFRKIAEILPSEPSSVVSGR